MALTGVVGSLGQVGLVLESSWSPSGPALVHSIPAPLFALALAVLVEDFAFLCSCLLVEDLCLQ